MESKAVKSAALRVAEELIKAREGNYYRQGWSSYIRRTDVELLLLAALSPTERAVYRRAVSVSK